MIPEDIRASITALFPQRNPTQLRALSLAAPPDRAARSTAELLARADAVDPALGDYARWIIATGAETDRGSTVQPGEQEIWFTLAAMRCVAYRRESAQLGVFLADHPEDMSARRRVVELTAAAREIERRFPGAGQRAQQELLKETSER